MEFHSERDVSDFLVFAKEAAAAGRARAK